MEQTYFTSAQEVVEIEIELLHVPSCALRSLDDRVVSELARSIQNAGLLQPILIRRSNGYELVFGRHRLEAFRRLGLKTIQANVRDMSDAEAFLARVSENLIRNVHVNPIEEAEGYRTLVESGWTISEIAKRIGKCDSYVSERLAILQHVDTDLRFKVAKGKGHLTPSHLELLSRIHDLSKQKDVAELVEKRRLSVRGLEDILNGVPPPMKIPVTENSTGDCCVTIPSEYVEAVRLSRGGCFHLYVRGKKLVLENLQSKRKEKTAGSKSPLKFISSHADHNV